MQKDPAKTAVTKGNLFVGRSVATTEHKTFVGTSTCLIVWNIQASSLTLSAESSLTLFKYNANDCLQSFPESIEVVFQNSISLNKCSILYSHVALIASFITVMCSEDFDCWVVPWSLGRASAQWEDRSAWPSEATQKLCGDHDNLNVKGKASCRSTYSYLLTQQVLPLFARLAEDLNRLLREDSIFADSEACWSVHWLIRVDIPLV